MPKNSTSNGAKQSKFKDVDISKYEEVWTKPKKAFAKKLLKEKEYTVTVNGIPQKVVGQPGHIDVYECGLNGDIIKNVPYEEDTFSKKFGPESTQQNLPIAK